MMNECEKKVIEIINLCRICGQTTVDGIDMYDSRGMQLRLQEKIKLHTPILLDYCEDKMPKKVCLECCNKLDAAQSLVITCLQTDQNLRKLLNINLNTKYDDRYADLITTLSKDLDNFINPNEVDTTDVVEPHCNNLYERYAVPDSIPDKETNNFMENTKIAIVEYSCVSQSQEILKNNVCDSKSMENTKEKAQFECNTARSVCEVSFDDTTTFEKCRSSCEENTVSVRGQDSVKSANDSSRSTKSRRYCGHCTSYFETRKELQNHIADCHNAQPLYKCGICEKSYEKWSSLDVHEATHRNDKPYLCDLCGKSFKHSNNLRGHKRIHLDDAKKKRHVCDICSSAFRSRFHLREHMNQHNGNRPYACETCGKTFYKRIQLRQHRLSHGSKTYACPICGVTFNRRGNMNTHLKRHEKIDGTYTCSVCEYKCNSMSELKTHRKEHSESEITASIRTKNANKTTIQCKICDKVFLKRAVLLNHEMTHESDRTRIECEKCGKKLANKSSLRYHNRSLHSTERPHMCQFCGESFVSKGSRLSHERIHTGERPYVCEICNMRYRCSSNLNQHMKIHSSLKPYACQYCYKSFTRKGSLVVHERIHTGCRTFACPICARAFSQKNDMMKHTTTHQSKPVKCETNFESKNELLQHLNEHEENVDDPVATGYTIITESLEIYDTVPNDSSVQLDAKT